MARVRYIMEIESEFTPEIEVLANTIPAWEQAGAPKPPPAEEPIPGPFLAFAVPDYVRLLARSEVVELEGGDRAMTFGTLNLQINLATGGSIKIIAGLTQAHVEELAAQLPRVQENLAIHLGHEDDDDEEEDGE